VKFAIYAESGAHWTNAKLQRQAYIRRRFYAVVLACFMLCGCIIWPSPQYANVRAWHEASGWWIVTWEVWGVEYHCQTEDRASALILDALLWMKGRDQ
jgi:hypothetical protein